MKENELFQSLSSVDRVETTKEVVTIAIMDNLLYNAAVRGYKNLPTVIANNSDEEINDIFHDLEWINLKVDEEYYTRKTRCKNNILHLSLQLEHFTFAEKAAKRFPQLISEVNAYGNNSLHVAGQFGKVDFVTLLVNLYEENINDEQSPPWMEKNKDGNTPLHVALIHGKIELARYLVNHDQALACICNHSNEAPLHLAIRCRLKDDQELVEDMMELVNNKEGTSSCYKLEKDSMPIVKLLLEKDPSVACWRDEDGFTPPLIAAKLNPSYVEAIYNMLVYCPESSEECDCFGNTILHLMNKLSIKDDRDAEYATDLLWLPSIGALKNRQNNDGDTPAHIAFKNDNIELIVILIKFSANLTVNNKKGVTAVDLIRQKPENFRTLIKKKAKELERGVSKPIKSGSYVSEEEIFQIGFSIERVKRYKMVHEKTEFGNILHTLLLAYPFEVQDNEVREFIKQVLEMEPSLICELNKNGQTPLHVTAQQRPWLIDVDFLKMIESYFKKYILDVAIVKGLVCQPPWAVQDHDGNTILHLALSNNWPGRWLEHMVEFDYNLAYQVNKKGEFPVHVFLRTVCNLDCRRKYANKVDSGLPYNVADSLKFITRWNLRASNSIDKDGFTPLLIAAEAKELEYFNILLDSHVEFHEEGDMMRNCHLKWTYDRDPYGNTFWHHLANVKVSDDYYDAINTETIWMKACSHACKALIQRNKSGKTPFHLAIENDNFKVAKMFSKTLHGDGLQGWKLSHSVYKDMSDQDGNVPLHLVVGRSNLSYAAEFIECVTTSTVSIGVSNKKGITPIHLAVLENDIQFLNIIFNVKRDDKVFTRQILQVTDTDHNTPLHYAISQGALSFVDMFFDQGIRSESIEKILDMSKDGNAPLNLAVLKGYSSLATKFIGSVKDKNNIHGMLGKRNTQGNTALHLTVLKGDLGIAYTLFKTAKENNYVEGVLDKCNNEGNTPMHLAIHNRDFELIKCFIEFAIEGSCINKILDIPNKKDETPSSLIGSAEHLPSKFENFFWNEPKVVQAMLGVRSLSGVPTKMIKEYTNTIGVIAALLATITFTAGFTVPGGLDSSNGTPLLMKRAAFQVFMVSDIIAMCLSMMVLFFLMWIMTINDEKHQVILLDLTVFLLQGAFYTTILTFMTGLYASVFPSSHWIAIFACVLCSLLILLMHKRLIIWFIPGFIHIYVWYQNVKKFCGRIACCCCNKNQNDDELSGTTSHANEPTGSQTFVDIEPSN